MSDLNVFIDAITSGDNETAQGHFDNLMNAKMQASLEAKRVEVAQKIYSNSVAEVQEEEE